MVETIPAGGTTLERDEHVIAQITKIGSMKITLETNDTTVLTSPDDFREKSGALFEAGTIPIEGFFYPDDIDGQIALAADQLAKTKQSFVITFPPAKVIATWSFTALVTEFEIGDYATGGEIGFKASLTPCTGKPILAIGASVGLTTTFFSISESAVIVPAPSNDEYEYVATVLTGVTSVTVTPIATAGVITVNGNVVETEEASSAITLGAAGSVTDITIIVTETGKVAKTYVIHVARASS